MNYLPDFLKVALAKDLNSCEDLKIDVDLINISDVLKAHYILADYFTDDSSDQPKEKMLVGVRSYDLLASAIGRQTVEFQGKRKYTDRIDICSTLFYGLVKDHAFHDGNKRTALLVLLYQLTRYGYYPQDDFKEFEKMVLVVADNRVPEYYKHIWKKFSKKESDPIIKTISYKLRRMTVKKNRSFHLDITMKGFCQLLNNVGVETKLIGMKIHFLRTKKEVFRKKKLQYVLNFYGWTRPVESKAARDTLVALELLDEYPNFASIKDADSNIYRIIRDFEIPLKRLKDE